MGLLIEVKSTNVKEIVLKILYPCHSTEGKHNDQKQKEIL
jgi:hypothetical protein